MSPPPGGVTSPPEAAQSKFSEGRRFGRPRADPPPWPDGRCTASALPETLWADGQQAPTSLVPLKGAGTFCRFRTDWELRRACEDLHPPFLNVLVSTSGRKHEQTEPPAEQRHFGKRCPQPCPALAGSASYFWKPRCLVIQKEQESAYLMLQQTARRLVHFSWPLCRQQKPDKHPERGQAAASLAGASFLPAPQASVLSLASSVAFSGCSGSPCIALPGITWLCQPTSRAASLSRLSDRRANWLKRASRAAALK